MCRNSMVNRVARAVPSPTADASARATATSRIDDFIGWAAMACCRRRLLPRQNEPRYLRRDPRKLSTEKLAISPPSEPRRGWPTGGPQAWAVTTSHVAGMRSCTRIAS
jgi:hypothetical protein